MLTYIHTYIHSNVLLIIQKRNKKFICSKKLLHHLYAYLIKIKDMK